MIIVITSVNIIIIIVIIILVIIFYPLFLFLFLFLPSIEREPRLFDELAYVQKWCSRAARCKGWLHVVHDALRRLLRGAGALTCSNVV